MNQIETPGKFDYKIQVYEVLLTSEEFNIIQNFMNYPTVSDYNSDNKVIHSFNDLKSIVDKIYNISFDGDKEMIDRALSVCASSLVFSIESHFKRAIEFIKWYNEQKSPAS